MCGCNSAEADRGHHILNVIKREFGRCLLELIILQPRRWLKAKPLQLALKQIAALGDIFLPLLLLEPLPDLASGMRGLRNLHPILARAIRVLRGQYFDDITGLQLMVQRNNPAVQLRAYRAVAYLRMDAVCKIERNRPCWQLDDLAARRKHEYEIREEIHLERFHKFGSVARFVLKLQYFTEPGHFIFKIAARHNGAFLVGPMGSNSIFRCSMHLPGPNLYLSWLSVRANHCRMQRLVHIRLRHRNIVLEPARHRLPQRMNNTQRRIAILNVINNDPDSKQIVNLTELLIPLRHFFVNAVQMLRPSGYISLNAHFFKLLGYP
ncbi:hypothetical protein D3C78_1099050 [compost metagenome]